jgi:hypothetical protein
MHVRTDCRVRQLAISLVPVGTRAGSAGCCPHCRDWTIGTAPFFRSAWQAHLLAQAQIRELEMALPVQQQVVWLDIAMDVPEVVHGFDGKDGCGE